MNGTWNRRIFIYIVVIDSVHVIAMKLQLALDIKMDKETSMVYYKHVRQIDA